MGSKGKKDNTLFIVFGIILAVIVIVFLSGGKCSGSEKFAQVTSIRSSAGSIAGPAQIYNSKKNSEEQPKQCGSCMSTEEFEKANL